MIRLTSKWKLKKGLTPELLRNLESTAERIQSKETGTLMYMIHPEESETCSSHGYATSNPVSDEKQCAITFIETYQDANEFSHHLEGEIFTNFLAENLKYFEEDPENPGWPATDTHMLKLDSGAIQHHPCHN